MFSVRGGLYGRLVVKVEMTSLGMILTACAVVSFGWTTVLFTVAVRVAEVRAGTNAATTDLSSRPTPVTAGATVGFVPRNRIFASRALVSTHAVAAAAWTEASSLVVSTSGARRPSSPGFMA